MEKKEPCYVLNDCVLDGRAIAEKVRCLGEEIAERYRGERLIIVGILKGAIVFLSDLIRAIGRDVDVRLDFLAVSSYGTSTDSSGVVKIVKDLETNIEGEHVLIVEDIVDTGLTLSYLRQLLLSREPKTLEICTLLDKPERRKTPVVIEYVGFAIPDVFVVGYGLDCGGRWRHLPSVCSVRVEQE